MRTRSGWVWGWELLFDLGFTPQPNRQQKNANNCVCLICEIRLTSKSPGHIRVPMCLLGSARASDSRVRSTAHSNKKFLFSTIAYVEQFLTKQSTVTYGTAQN